MAAITNPGTADKDTYRVTEMAGEYKMLSFYNLALTTASDALTVSFLDNGISEIQNVLVNINAGQKAAFTAVAASFSSLIVTVTSVEEDGSAATEWSGTTINMLIIGK